MENRSHALLAGIFTLFFACAAGAALWWFSGPREPMTTYLLETRGNVTGLNVEGQVRYRGIRAGKVREIRADESDPSRLLVEISLPSRFRLTDRTLARLNNQGVTGLTYVMLEEGVAGTGQALDTSTTVPPRIPLQPGFMDRLGEKAGDIAGQLAELTARLNRVLDERATQQIGRSIDNLAQASEGLRELPKLMAAARAILSEENLRRLNATLAHLEKTAGEAPALAAEVRALVGTLNSLSKQMENAAASASSMGDRLQGDTLPRVEALMAEAMATSRRLEKLLGSLNETPQALLFGMPPPLPGPGERGFAP